MDWSECTQDRFRCDLIEDKEMMVRMTSRRMQTKAREKGKHVFGKVRRSEKARYGIVSVVVAFFVMMVTT
jgi:hypothetical protein